MERTYLIQRLKKPVDYDNPFWSRDRAEDINQKISTILSNPVKPM